MKVTGINGKTVVPISLQVSLKNFLLNLYFHLLVLSVCWKCPCLRVIILMRNWDTCPGLRLHRVSFSFNPYENKRIHSQSVSLFSSFSSAKVKKSLSLFILFSFERLSSSTVFTGWLTQETWLTLLINPSFLLTLGIFFEVLFILAVFFSFPCRIVSTFY